MAIVQISQITNRKGLQENLPQLAGAELGWSIDERRLFIGNGTLEEGAPVIGNTEILTEFSNIFDFGTVYTYQGAAAGYTVQTGPTPGTPVIQSLQSWLDQFATVKDFGAVGDGITDDTDAINRALYQIYCREINPQIRRSLFFPAGVYLVRESILIPPFATLYGEGLDNTIIRLSSSEGDSTLVDYVARTCDSLQQIGANIGNNGAITPQYVTISNMSFDSIDVNSSIFLVQDATNCRFQNTGFTGPLTTASLTTESTATKSVDFASTNSLVCEQIVFDGCKFGGTTWAVNTNQQVKGVTVTNSMFDTLYKGVLLGTDTVVNGGATGFRITGNLFDNIYAEGIVFGDVSLNASGKNIFYDVGNHFAGTTSPATVIIDIQSANNLSISDLFERADNYATTYVRVNLNNTASIATTNGQQLSLGGYTRESGLQSVLINNNTSTVFTINTTNVHAFAVNYTIVRNTTYRTGTILVSATSLTYSDDYVENASTGIGLSFSQAGSNVSMDYTATNTGVNGTITYSINYLA